MKKKAKVINKKLLRNMPLPQYSDDASKADYGKMLLISGSQRLPGPAILAGKAALRCGCGTVRVAAPASICTAVGVAVPELMMIPLPETSRGTVAAEAWQILTEQFEACDAAVLGPGLDNHDETNELCLQVIAECPLPLLIDAQALVALSKVQEAPDYGVSLAPRVLTPHPSEMSALINIPVDEIESYREKTAKSFTSKAAVTLVLKGRETLIGSPVGDLYVNTAGTRGMGTAGSGDVLAGIVGGSLTQKMDSTEAAVWGVHLHALAGEEAASKLGDDGMMASDFLEMLPCIINKFR